MTGFSEYTGRCGIAVPLLLASFGVMADNGMYPNVGADIDITAFQYDYTRNDSGSKKTGTDGYFDINPVIYFRLTPNSEIWLDVEANPINPPDPGENRWFGDIGLTVNDLNFYHSNNAYWFRLGKFDVPYGRAWDISPGLYTPDFIDEYNFGGVIGGVYAYRFNAGNLGIISPIVNTYFLDTSALSRSYLQSDSRLDKSDGGAANTEKFNNYSLVLNWSGWTALPNLEAQVGYVHNHQGDDGNADEEGYVASLYMPIVLKNSSTLAPVMTGKYIDIVPFVEYASFSDKDGIRGQDLDILSASVTLDYGYWQFAVSNTTKDASGAGTSGPDDFLTELSVVYNFTNLWSVQVGGGKQRDGGVKSRIFGISFDYSYSF